MTNRDPTILPAAFSMLDKKKWCPPRRRLCPGYGCIFFMHDPFVES